MLCWALLALAGMAPAIAQDSPLLTGPLLATHPATQDSIILVDLGTRATRTLRLGAGWHMVWGFVQDGCRLVYTLSDGPAQGRLYSARLDGSDPRPLVDYTELRADEWGVWEPQPSPDGARVAFTFLRRRALPDGSTALDHHIAWVPAGGGEPTLYSATGDEHEPRWSPDGNWLAYISYTERAPGADPLSTAAPPQPGQPAPIATVREADLWVVSTDGGTKYPLTDFMVGSVRGPRWNGDSQIVSFVYAPTPGNDQFWMIGNVPGAISTQLSGQYTLILDTTWYPDSTAILASARDLQGLTMNALWRIPLVGLADTGASRFPATPPLDYADYPRFSADGRWLAARTNYDLALLDTTSGAWVSLGLPPGNTPAVWSPAGFAGEAACA